MQVRRVRVIGVVVTLALVFGVGTVAAAQTAWQTMLKYTFEQSIKTDDQGHQYVPDATGLDHKGYVRFANGGGITLVPKYDGGTAAKFPRQCDPNLEICPKALIEVENKDPDDLNPGSAPFSFGAHVRIDGQNELTLNGGGMNIIQKGLSNTPGGQWKLQVDSPTNPARPSCHVRGESGSLFVIARGVDVADGEWHKVACKKEKNRLSIWIDDNLNSTKEAPDGIGSVSTEQPVTVGAKWLPGDPNPNNPDRTLGQANDQFHGALDKVIFRRLG